MKTLLLVLALAAPADELPAPSYLFKLGGKYTGGTGGYRNKSGYVQAGRAWKLKAGFSSCDYDGSTLPVRTGTLRLSYQGEHLSASVSGSVTPLVEEYRSRGSRLDLGFERPRQAGSDDTRYCSAGLSVRL